ncbi:MAG: gliding motility-associated C-terminal domain-containing protein, partial [Sediminibacterium sp.]|nr:gliding motility-associated C-terminal domain-containing protein [Sediminibacterium sp.]
GDPLSTTDTIINDGTGINIAYRYWQNGNLYRLDSVNVNGISQSLVGKESNFILSNITQNTTVNVVFKRQYNIITSVINGSITPSAIVDSSSNYTITYVANLYSILFSVTINSMLDVNKSNDSRDGDYLVKSFTLSNVNKNYLIQVVYKRRTVVEAEVVNGRIFINNDESSPLFVDSGSTPVVSYIGKSPNYKIDSIFINNIYNDMITTDSLIQYSFTNIDNNGGKLRVVYFLPLYITKLNQYIVKAGDSLIVYGKNLNNLVIQKGNQSIYYPLIVARKEIVPDFVAKPRFGPDTAYYVKLPNNLEDDIYVIRGILEPDTSNFILFRSYKNIGHRIVGWGDDAFGKGESTDTFQKLITYPVVASAGANHNIVLTTQGNVLGWGKNDFGQGESSDNLITQKNVVDISAGNDFNIALLANGTVFSWGKNSDNQVQTSQTNSLLKNIVKISAGDNHGLALTERGLVIGWGNNNFNKINGGGIQPGINNIIDISAGLNHNIALKSDNSIIGWGDDTYQIAASSNTNNRLTQINQISAGGDHNVALNTNFDVVGWGKNDFNQGLSNMLRTNTIQVSAGLSHNISIFDSTKIIGWRRTVDSLKVFGWGQNQFKQGDSTNILKKLQFPVKLDAGYNHNILLKKIGIRTKVKNGTVSPDIIADSLFQNVQITFKGLNGYIVDSIFINGIFERDFSFDSFESFTFNRMNQDNNFYITFKFPFYLTSISRVIVPIGDTMLVVGSNLKKIIITEVGTNYNQEVIKLSQKPATKIKGVTDTIYSIRLPQDLKPNKVYILQGVFDTDTTRRFLLFRVYDLGPVRVLGWGDNNFNAGASTDTFSKLKNIIHIEAGSNANLALDKFGKVYGWGLNNFGQGEATDTLSKLNTVVDFSTGKFHNIALRSNGTVVGWGSNNSKQGQTTDTMSILKNIVAISAGSFHNIALTLDGKIIGWGNNVFNQGSSSKFLSFDNPIYQIGAGDYFNIFLQRDGSLKGNGSNFYFEDPNDFVSQPQFTQIKDIAVGYDHFLAQNTSYHVLGAMLDIYGQGATTDNLGKLINITNISAGGLHNIALNMDSLVKGWGNNDFKQGEATDTIAKLTRIVAISAGNTHNIALKRITVKTQVVNGNITPTVLVDSLGQTVTINYSSDTVFPIDSIFINGIYNPQITLDSLKSYTFYNVQFDSSIKVVFRVRVRIIAEVVNGYIAPVDTTIEIGQNVVVTYQILNPINYVLDSVIINKNYNQNYLDSENRFWFINKKTHQNIRVVYSPYPVIIQEPTQYSNRICQYNNLDSPIKVRVRASINPLDTNVKLKTFQWYVYNNYLPKKTQSLSCIGCFGNINVFDTILTLPLNTTISNLDSNRYFIIVSNDRNLKDTSALSGQVLIYPVPQSTLIINNLNTIECILEKEGIRLEVIVNDFDTIDYSKINLFISDSQNYYRSKPINLNRLNPFSNIYYSDTLFSFLPRIAYVYGTLTNIYNCNYTSPNLEVQWFRKLNNNAVNLVGNVQCYGQTPLPLIITQTSKSKRSDLYYTWFVSKYPSYVAADSFPNSNDTIFYPLNLRKAGWDSAYYFVTVKNIFYSCAKDTSSISGLINTIYPSFKQQPNPNVLSKVCQNTQLHQALQVLPDSIFLNNIKYDWYKYFNADSSILIETKYSNRFIPPNSNFDTSQYFAIMTSTNLCGGLMDTSKISGKFITFPFPQTTFIPDSVYCIKLEPYYIHLNYSYPWQDSLVFAWYRTPQQNYDSAILLDSSNKAFSLNLTYYYNLNNNINNYFYTIKNSQNCLSKSNVANLKLADSFGIVIDTIGKKPEVLNGTQFQVKVISTYQLNTNLTIPNAKNLSIPSTFFWEPKTLVYPLTSNLNEIVKLQPTEPTWFHVHGWDINRCYYEGRIFVNYIDKPCKLISLYPSKIVTPNNDGINDYWVIKNIEYFDSTEIIIYNTLNQFSKSFNNFNYLSKWYGHTQYYTVLDNGTYYYIIRILDKGCENEYRGFFELRRSD